MSSTGSDPNPFRFGGQVGYYTDLEASSGLILCGMRWYDPAIARWISRDPIGYEGGANLYTYCSQNPVNGIDPSGLDSVLQFLQHEAEHLPQIFESATAPLRGLDPDASLVATASIPAVAAHSVATVSTTIAAGGVASASVIGAPIALGGGALYLMGVSLNNNFEAEQKAQEALSESTAKLNSLRCAALRKQFDNVVKPAYWKRQAKLPGNWTGEDLARMRKGDPPKGPDGKSMEIHHIVLLINGGTNDLSNLIHYSRADHRIGPNFRKNHPK